MKQLGHVAASASKGGITWIGTTDDGDVEQKVPLGITVNSKPDQVCLSCSWGIIKLKPSEKQRMIIGWNNGDSCSCLSGSPNISKSSHLLQSSRVEKASSLLYLLVQRISQSSSIFHNVFLKIRCLMKGGNERPILFHFIVRFFPLAYIDM